jgi:hypothetical protein
MIATLCIVAWLGLGAWAAWVGNRDIRRRFPHQDHGDEWLMYATSVLGPINWFAIWVILFSGLNPREPK